MLLDGGVEADSDAGVGAEATPAALVGHDAAPSDAGEPVTPVPLATAVVIAACVVPTVVLGIWAGPLADLASRATQLFHP